MEFFEKVVIPSVGIALKETYNFSEARRLIGCSPKTLRKFTKEGRLHQNPAGRFYREDIAKFCCTPKWEFKV